MTPSDRAPAVALLLEHNEMHFAVRGDFRLIDEWISQGCDMERDIIPTMKDTIGRRGPHNKINSIGYFTPIIYAARDRRLSVEAARKCAAWPNTSEPSSEARARNIAYLTRKLGRMMPTEARWLSEYESQHGEVVV